LIVWKYPNSSSGHIGFILKKTGTRYVKTLEGNTSWDNSSPDGRNFAGKKGVFVKIRRIDKLGKMELRGVVQ
jgi:AMMECR1 domain-containing protein